MIYDFIYENSYVLVEFGDSGMANTAKNRLNQKLVNNQPCVVSFVTKNGSGNNAGPGSNITNNNNNNSNRYTQSRTQTTRREDRRDQSSPYSKPPRIYLLFFLFPPLKEPIIQPLSPSPSFTP